MNAETVYAKLAACRVIPVVAIDSVDAAVGLADALIAGGLPVAEITFRTAAAAEVIKTLSRERPQLLVGAGTVLTPEHAREAKACGAAFAVSPGFNPNVVKAAQACGLPFAPGIMTPSDIEGALTLGLRVLKFFPAGAAGGLKMLKSIAAPYAHLGVRFIPTGGVNPDNLQAYLADPAVLAAGGTWLAGKDAINAGDWPSITAACAAACRLAQA